MGAGARRFPSTAVSPPEHLFIGDVGGCFLKKRIGDAAGDAAGDTIGDTSVKSGTYLVGSGHSISEFSSNHASPPWTPITLASSHDTPESLLISSAMLSRFHCVLDCAMRR